MQRYILIVAALSLFACGDSGGDASRDGSAEHTESDRCVERCLEEADGSSTRAAECAESCEPFLSVRRECPEDHKVGSRATIEYGACSNPYYHSESYCAAGIEEDRPVQIRETNSAGEELGRISFRSCTVPVVISADGATATIPNRYFWVEGSAESHSKSCELIESIELKTVCHYVPPPREPKPEPEIPPLLEIPIEAQNCSIIGDDGPAPSCAIGGVESFRFKLSRIEIPSTSALVGFNLDCYHTTAQDRYGCRKLDGPGGIDNSLAALANIFKTVAGIDLNASIAEGITDGSTALTIVVSGYDGEGDDDCVTVRFLDEDDQEIVPPTTAIIREEGDRRLLIVALDMLPLNIPFDDQFITFGISNVRIELPIASDGSGIKNGVLGGSVVWETADGGGLSGFFRGLLASFDSIGIDIETVAPIVMGMLDLHVPAINDDPNSCSAISVGLSIDGVAL